MSQLSSTTLLADANLKAYYKFDVGALTTDSGSLGKTLTNTGTVLDGEGVWGGGADLGANNSTKWLTIADNMGIDGGACSLSIWVKMQTEIAASTYTLIDTTSANSKVRHEIIYNYNSGTRQVGFYRSKGGVGAEGFGGTVTLGVANWYHLVYTYDNTSIYGYLNGVEVSHTTASGNGTDAATPNRSSIGVRSYELARAASMKCDEAAYFNRALTAPEVLTLYKRNFGNFLPFI